MGQVGEKKHGWVGDMYRTACTSWSPCIIPCTFQPQWSNLEAVHARHIDLFTYPTPSDCTTSSPPTCNTSIQEHPDTLLSVEYRPVWYRRGGTTGGGTTSSSSLSSSSRAVSVWRPVGPPGYVALGDVAVVSEANRRAGN